MNVFSPLNFFIDIDGTLFNRNIRELTPLFKSTVKKAQSLGCKFFINTARPSCVVPDSLSKSSVFDGVCSGGGTYIELNSKCIYSKFVPNYVVYKMAEYLFDFGQDLPFIFEGLNACYYIGKKPMWFDDNLHEISNLSDFENKYGNPIIQKFSVPSPVYPGDKFMDVFSNWFDICLHKTYSEGIPKGYGKGTAIKLTEETLNLPHSASVSVGDSDNDSSMFRYTDISVAMGNSPDEIKSMCTMVTDTVDNDGVAKAICKLINL